MLRFRIWLGDAKAKKGEFLHLKRELFAVFFFYRDTILEISDGL